MYTSTCIGYMYGYIHIYINICRNVCSSKYPIILHSMYNYYVLIENIIKPRHRRESLRRLQGLGREGGSSESHI